MQVVITKDTFTGKLQYHYQTRIISKTSLHLGLPSSPDQTHPWQKLEEPWANKLLLNPQMSFKLSEYTLMTLSKT